MAEMVDPMSEWQPIETAPRDGSKMLLCVAGFEPAVGRYDRQRGMFDYLQEEDMPDDAAWQRCLESNPRWDVTHWMPLPAPPK